MIVTVLILLAVPFKVAKSRESSLEPDEDEPSIEVHFLTEMTWYDPEICLLPREEAIALGFPDPEVNCMGDPTKTAGGYHVPDWYNKGAACTSEFKLGTIIKVDGFAPMTCIDRGGAINIKDGIVRLDRLQRYKDEPVWRQVRHASAILTQSEIQAILNEHGNIFVQPAHQFSCPATTCDEVFFPFGVWVNPEPGVSYLHNGVDFYTGDPGKGLVFAAGSGAVIASGYVNNVENRCGGRIEIDHGNGWRTIYCHLTERLVEIGDVVEVGDPIGKAGFSGYTLEGQHVHVELKQGNTPYDILQYMGSGDEYIPVTPDLFLASLESAGIALQGIELEKSVVEVAEQPANAVEKPVEIPESEGVEEEEEEVVQVTTEQAPEVEEPDTKDEQPLEVPREEIPVETVVIRQPSDKFAG